MQYRYYFVLSEDYLLFWCVFYFWRSRSSGYQDDIPNLKHRKEGQLRVFYLNNITVSKSFINTYICGLRHSDHNLQAAMPETAQETCTPVKDSPFFIKNLLNCDSKPSKPKPIFASAKVAFEGGFSLSQVGDFNFPRFELPTQRFALPAHYLERASAWWYPYTLSAASHLHRTEGKSMNIWWSSLSLPFTLSENV